MPRFVKGNRIIFASNKAYETIYREQGFLPLTDEKVAEAKENAAPATDTEEAVDIVDEEQDDYEDETDGGLDPNDAMPLAARVGLLSYEQLKEEAKKLGIPKYANTKREELERLIIEAMEAKNAE